MYRRLSLKHGHQVASFCLLFALLAAYGCNAVDADQPPLSLRFQPLVAGTPAQCGAPVKTPTASIQLTDLRFYVHDVRFVHSDGTETTAALIADGRWQTESLALMDLEDGTGACENGSREMHDTLVLSGPNASTVGIRFRIGVPFELNHDNPATNPSPLNVTAMSWGWMGGHKFMRLEAEVDGFSHLLHLASTGCEGTIGNISRCDRGNRPEIEVNWGTERPHSLAISIDTLLGLSTEGASASAATDWSCMSTRRDPACLSPFRALGLDVETGTSMLPAIAFEGR